MAIEVTGYYIAVKRQPQLWKPFTGRKHYVASMRQDTKETLAKNLRFLMERTHLSEKKLAEKAGCSQKTVNNILNQRHPPKLDTLDEIAGAFGLNLWNLIHPSLINDIRAGGTISTLITNYFVSSEEGRRLIYGIAEREATYQKSNKK